MKFFRLFVSGALSCVLMLSLCSCNIKETAAELWGFSATQVTLVRDEFWEIAEFFSNEPGGAGITTPTASEAATDAPLLPTVVTLRHIEIVESPYNSADRTVIFSAGNVDLSDKTETFAEGETLGYTRVPRFDEKSADSLAETLRAAGIDFDIIERKNPAPAGEVFALEFAGISDMEAYYINADIPVTLYVSSEKEAVMSDGGGMTVYLTYDDGPSGLSTERLLDVLDTYGIKATFFTMGNSVKKYPAEARLIADRGHILACHSVTHDYEKIYSSADALIGEVQEWERIVADTGITLTHRLFRFPGGSVSKYLTTTSEGEMRSRLEGMGYTVFDWNVVTNDALLFMREDGENVYDYIRKNFIETFELCLAENKKKEAPIIILMHENVSETVDLMPWMIEYLIDSGYTFGSLSDLGDGWTFAERK